MLKENNMFFNPSQGSGHGLALGWVVDSVCVHSMILSKEFADIFLTSDTTIDITPVNNLNNKINIRFLKNNEVLEEIEVSEKFGSILLSNPKIINLSFHKFGYLVEDDKEYIFENYEINPGGAWKKFETGFYFDKQPLDPLIKCYDACGCNTCLNSCLCGWSN
jgi:hypothetical protein